MLEDWLFLSGSSAPPSFSAERSKTSRRPAYYALQRLVAIAAGRTALPELARVGMSRTNPFLGTVKRRIERGKVKRKESKAGWERLERTREPNSELGSQVAKPDGVRYRWPAAAAANLSLMWLSWIVN